MKYGNLALVFSNLITNTTTNLAYRQNFLLQSAKGSTIGLLSSTLFSGLIPAAIGGTFMSAFHFNSLLKSTQNECSLCRDVKSIGLHLTFGSVLSSGCSWLINLYQASIYNTIRMPSIDGYFSNIKNKKYRSVFYTNMKQVLKQTNKGMYKVVFTNYSIQLFLCSLMLYHQEKEFIEHIEPLRFSMDEIKRIKGIF